MLSLIPSVAILGVAALVSLQLALGRPSPEEKCSERATASRLLALTTVIQCGHFAEEWATGFHESFPALFSLDPMSLPYFVGFNLVWIAIWFGSVPLLRTARKPAFFAAWFLAIAGTLNGVAHPMLAVYVGGYFPGLMSSPFIGLASVYLWKQLSRSTSNLEASLNETPS